MTSSEPGITYLYLDDEEPESVAPYVSEVVDRTPGLTIEHHAPRPYGRQLSWLRQRAYDGLILDLRLDQKPNWEEHEVGQADYRAAGLAQELRTRAAETGSRAADVPIVLWSTDEKLRKTYRRDDFSHDLYDRKTVKDTLTTPGEAGRIGRELISLARGYKEIERVSKALGYRLTPFHRFLGLEEEPAFVDPRVLGNFDGRSSLPVHVIARFILSRVLEPEGPLIDRRTLLARVGMADGDSEVHGAVISLFGGARYQGPFADGWPRWWGVRVESVWQELTDDASPLRRLSADERTAVLAARLGEEVVPAEVLPGSTSSRYWTVCHATGRPIDPRDGFALIRRDEDPWIADAFVSAYAIKQGLLRETGLVLAPLEESRAATVRRQ